MGFVGLYTGLSGIRAAQTGIDVSSNNISNASTPGYTRQRVDQSARPSYTSLAGQVGTGVDVTSISRLRDAFLDDRARSAIGDAGFDAVRADVLTRMEDLTGEPDLGVTGQLQQLWAAAESWANDPADTAGRRQVLTELGGVTEALRSTASQWSALAEDLRSQQAIAVDEVNEALAELTRLDDRIANADTSRVGADVFDQRDMLLDRVAELTGARARIGEDGRSDVRLGGTELTGAQGPVTLQVDEDGVLQVLDTDGNEVDDVEVRGTIGGYDRVLTDDIPNRMAELDTFAEQLAEQINGVNGRGYTAEGDPGVDLLEFGDPVSAATLRLADGVEPASLAAASQLGPDGPPAPHQDGNAHAFADLRLAGVDGDGEPTTTLDAAFADLVTGLAAEVRSARSAAEASSAIASQAHFARQAEHGVSYDEEMVDLVKYQRALEAASRVMTTVDEALDVLVNRTGVVGR